MAVLKGISGDNKGVAIELAEGETSIGRHGENDVQLTDMSVSSFHCTILNSGGKYTVKDLDSTNGTHMEGNRISMRPLVPGCALLIGSVEFVFEDEDAVPDATATDGAVALPVPGDVADSAVPGPSGGTRAGFRPNTGYGAKTIWIIVGAVSVVAVLGIITMLVVLVSMK